MNATQRFATNHRSAVVLTSAAIALAGLYFGIHQPLARRAEANEASVSEARRQLASRQHELPPLAALDVTPLNQHVAELQQAVASLELVRQETVARYDMPEATHTRIRAGFQLVAYQSELLMRWETLSDRAQESGTDLSPQVLDGLPVFSLEHTKPELLWAQLTTMHRLVDTAISCKVRAIHEIVSLPPQDHRSPGGGRVFLHRIPARIQVSGSYESIATLLGRLPRLRSDLEAGTPPTGAMDSPALLLERIRLRKRNPAATDEVLLDLQVCGFVFPREQPMPPSAQNTLVEDPEDQP